MADDAEPVPDYAALVDRELRIAANLRVTEALWQTILADYADESRRQRYVR